MSNVYTLKLSGQDEMKLYQAWKESAVKPPAYAKWQLKCENCMITCYESGKTVFQGKDAEVYASPFMDSTPQIQKNSKKQSTMLPQAGSDEVGTGDYFGPVCVCACIVNESSEQLLKKLGARDSKQLKDEDILKIAPQIIDAVPHSLLILGNEKYNEVHKTNNLNAIKAKLHNQAYVHLQNRYGLPQFRIIDQFAPETAYYRYLKDQPLIIHQIHFETKAEDKYPAVGAASVIARYAFLKSMAKMEADWKMQFQKGAGSNVDQCAKEFVEKYGFNKLNKVAKLHFKNTEKLKWM